MKKITTSLLLFLIALGVQAASKNGHFFKVLKNENVSVENVEQRFAEWFALPPTTEWKLVGERTDQLGMQRIEYRQYVSGVEVEHSQILLHVKDGKVLAANGTVMEASRTPAKVRSGSVVYIGGTPTDLMGRKLFLVNTKDGYRYALKMLAMNGMKWVYTDAETGEVIKQVSTIHNIDRETTPKEPAKVKGKGIFCGEVTMDASRSANNKNYLLYDQQRNIYTLLGAYLPSAKEMVEMHNLFDYMPQGNLPSNYDEITEEALKKWVEEMDMVEPNEAMFDVSRYVNEFSKLVKSDKPYFDAYTLTGITINKISYKDEHGQLVEMVPSPDDLFTSCKMAITYGYPKNYGDISNGFIDEQNLNINELPYSTDEDFRLRCDEIPAEGATLTIMVSKPMVDENGNFQFLEDGDLAFGFFPAAYIPFIPDETGLVEYNKDGTEIELTYEKGPSAVVDIHWGMEKTLDFYKEVFNRDSYDDEGAPVYNLVFLNNDSKTNLFAIPLDNAAAAYGWAPNPMIYGMGDNTQKPCVELSVMAHEFTHLVTGFTAGLEYRGESGAINEAFSDMMGISVKKYARGDEGTWYIGGDDMLLEYSNIRDMAHPENSRDGETPAPSTYNGEYWVDTEDISEDTDKGGVHTNSSVGNKWFFLVTDGEEGVNGDDFEYDVKGIGIEKSRQIAYRAVVSYASEESQYADFRLCTLQAAADLYGDNSEEVKSVADAWDAVGVYDDEMPPMLDGIAGTEASRQQNTTVYDLMGRIVNAPSKGVYIKNGKKYAVK